MPISFECAGCGKSYMTSDETAGKLARCKECGNTMTIPRPSDVDRYALAEPAPLPPGAFDDDDETHLAPRRPAYERAKNAAKTADGGSSAKQVGGVVSVLAVIGIIAAKVVLRLVFSHLGGRGHRPPPPPPLAPPAVAVNANIPVNANGPIALPPFPDPGPGRPLEPGIELHEIRLPGGPQPGFGGKLWLYLPSGAHPDKSLPCVLITAAGSNLITGMDLSEGDRPEHLPYVRAGFAVLAFELDGAMPDPQATRKFLAARAGLVNAHIALEYLLAKVPQVDPERLYAAGHSSAGTLALLFAEHEPRLKGCIAFAPVVDLARRPGFALLALQQPGLRDLTARYSPKNNEAKLSCPLFLFHARDDSNVPVQGSVACAQRLQRMGKTVTLEMVPTGNHYDSMIQEGIPRALAWLQAQQPGAAPAPAPKALTAPPNNGFPPPPR